MPTFVEEVQSVPADDPREFRRRVADRVEAVGDAVSALESWTEESHDARTELVSKYEAAKTLARDEIREASAVRDGDDAAASDRDDAGPDGIPAADLLDHPDVTEGTRQRLREYSTKLHAFLDEEQSYGEARERLRAALGTELSRYERLLADVGAGVSVRDAQSSLARFAREETPGRPTQTATDVILESVVDADGETD